MTVEIEKSGRTEIDFYRKVVALTEDLASDHRGFLSDGDLATDIEELADRVMEYLPENLDEAETRLFEKYFSDDYTNIFELALYEGCRNYYVNGEPSTWEEDVNPTEPDLYLAFVNRGIATPYTVGDTGNLNR